MHISSARSWRGGERQLCFLAGELHRRGIRQAVLCSSGSVMARWCAAHGICFFTYKKIFSLNPLVGWKIRALNRKNHYTHIHTHDSHSHGFALMATAFLGVGVPVIVHRRVDFPVKNLFFSKWKYNHPSVRAIICVSGFIEKMVRPSIYSDALVTTVHSGIDLGQHLAEGKKNIREELGIPADHRLVVNLAAIAPHKDYYTFVNAAEIILRKKNKTTFLLIGGDGGEAASIHHFIKNKNLEKNLLMIGHRTDVPEILQQVDLLLFTSKTEGLGGAVLDAMQFGVPVVVTAAGGIPEIVDHGVDGFVAPVGDAKKLAAAAIEILENNKLQKQFIEKGKEKVLQFSKEKTAEKILDIYITIARSQARKL